MKALVTTVPFGDKDRLPLDLLEKNGIEYVINPTGKKLTENQLAEMVTDFDVLIAGTEPITDFVMSKASRLKLISRVGIGLDGVDLLAAKKRGITVSYTPDAPAPAVSELTMALMLSLLRSVHVADKQLHGGHWERHFGRRVSELTIGIIGVGRIGARVLNLLSSFGDARLLLNDIDPNTEINEKYSVDWVSKEEILREADVISLHLPLTALTKDLIRTEELLSMKKDAVIINTSRGGIINEQDLYDVMKRGHLSGAAIDVFEVEPYDGVLREIDRCILTAHMGSMSIDCRTKMEIAATEEVVRFYEEIPLEGTVPKSEYDVQLQGL